MGRQTRNLLQDLLERPIVVQDQFNLVLQHRSQYPSLLVSPKSLEGRVSDDDRDGLRLRQQPQNVFDKSNLIEPHPNHDVLPGQQGLFNPAYFDQREHHRRCRIQVCPALLDEASRGRIKRDDQIGRSLSVDGLEIVDKFGLSCVVGTPSRDEGEFLDVQRPGRLSVQFLADRLAPCGPRLEILAIRMKDHDFLAERQSRHSTGRRSRRLRRQERQRRRRTDRRAASPIRRVIRISTPTVSSEISWRGSIPWPSRLIPCLPISCCKSLQGADPPNAFDAEETAAKPVLRSRRIELIGEEPVAGRAARWSLRTIGNGLCSTRDKVSKTEGGDSAAFMQTAMSKSGPKRTDRDICYLVASEQSGH